MEKIMKDLKNSKVVIITGCASGIGKSVVDKYLSKGFFVIGIDKIQSDYKENFMMLQADLSVEDDVKRLYKIISDKFSEIDYLINCAGIFYETERAHISNISLSEWNSVINNNLNSCLLVVKNFLPLLKNNQKDKGIVFISSDQSEWPRSKNCAYSTSKGAINTFAKACAVEFLEYGIRVNVVEPASVETNFIRKMVSTEDELHSVYDKENAKMPMGIIKPDEVAELVYFFGSHKSVKITGQKILIDSGLYLK